MGLNGSSERYKLVGEVKKVLNVKKDSTSLLLSGILHELNKDKSYKSTKPVEYQFVHVKNTPQNIEQGIEYEFYGNIVKGTNGKQDAFFANIVNIKVALSEEGIIKFVTRNAKKIQEGKAVGKKTIEKIVDEFGDKTWDIVNNTPELILEKCKGINDGHIVRLQKLHEKMYGSLDIINVLTTEYNFRGDVANNVVKKLGTQTLQTLQNNPYSLCKIKGVGFKTIDSFAITKNKIDPKSIERIREGAVFVMEDNEKSGHSFIYNEGKDGITYKLLNELGYADKIKEELINDGIFESEVEDSQRYKDEIKEYKELIKQALNELEAEDKSRIRTRTVFRKTKNDGQYKTKQYYLTQTYYDELYVADRLVRMAKTEINVDIPLIKDIISQLEKQEGITLSEQQKNGILLALKSRICILTGAAGTGKSTTSKIMIQTIRKFNEISNNDPLFILTAPTGMAAKRLRDITNLNAATIHSTLGYNSTDTFNFNENNQLESDELISDEVSMIGLKLFSSQLKAIPEKCRLILIGDPNQLPSIEHGNVLYDIINSGVIPTVKLDKIYRQKEGKKLIKHAHDVLNGKTPEIDSALLTKNNIFGEGYDTLFIEYDYLHEYKQNHDDFFVKLCKNIIPKYYPDKEIQILTPQKSRSKLSTTSINYLLQQAYNPKSSEKEELKITKTGINYILREGDKVINTVNQDLVCEKSKRNIRVNNGEIGYIVKIFRENGKQLMVVDFSGTRYQFISKQINAVELAYAITIHKSQGSEFPVVIICLDKGCYFELLQRGLIYTGMTRGKELVIFYGHREALQRAVRNNKTIKRRTYLSKLLQQKF